MANFKLTQTGEQIQADLDLLDKNSATQGQVLTANGTGGASWQNVSGGGSSSFTGYNITTVGDSNPSSKSASINVMRYNNTYYSYSTSTLGDSVEGAYAIWWYGDYDTNYPQKFVSGTLIDSTDGHLITCSNTNINTLTAKRMYYVASDLVIDTSN